MKSVLSRALLLLATALPTQLLAQTVPNGGLETWLTRNGGDVPQGWVTSDDLYARLGLAVSQGTVSKTTTAHGGSFAARVAVQSIFGRNLIGVLVLGDVSRVGLTFNTASRGGIPFTARPTQVQFWYRFSGAANDSANFYLELRRGAGTAARQVGVGTRYLVAPAANTAVYTLATLPITYGPNSLPPDSLRIYLSVGSTRSSTTAVLLLDDLTLTLPAATAQGAAQPAWQVYPNPSTNGQFVLRTADAALAHAAVEILDSQGQLLRAWPARPSAGPVTERLLDLGAVPAGLYLLRVSGRADVCQRLVVE